MHYSAVSSSSCQVYLSEYAYRDDSVTRAESANANCRRYYDIPRGVHTQDYIHCDGTQLKLTDLDFGQEQYCNTYRSSDYYVWSAGSGEHLLFIFPTRVSVRGLPRLRFYAAPDDFNVWDALTLGTPYSGVASIPPGGEPVGRRSISINANLNTRKVLIYKYSSSFSFALSEVEFNNFTCTCSCKCMHRMHKP